MQGHRVDACKGVTQEYNYEKNIRKGRGTWGSNPGPRDYQHYALPTAPNARLVYIISNK